MPYLWRDNQESRRLIGCPGKTAPVVTSCRQLFGRYSLLKNNVFTSTYRYSIGAGHEGIPQANFRDSCMKALR